MKKLLKICVAFLLAMAVMMTVKPGTASAADEEIPAEMKKGYTFSLGTGEFRVIKDNSLEVEFVKPSNGNINTLTVPGIVAYIGRTYTVTKIADRALYGNKSIRVAELGPNISVIGKNAFAYCTSLMRLTIPANVTKINGKAFYGCKKLATIDVVSTNIKTVAKYAFSKIAAKAVFKLPTEKFDSYKKLIKNSKVNAKTVYKKK